MFGPSQTSKARLRWEPGLIVGTRRRGCVRGLDYGHALQAASEGPWSALPPDPAAYVTHVVRVRTGLANEGEPGTEELARLSKIVFSRKLAAPLSWPNTRWISEDPVRAVRKMKESGKESLRTMCSLTLCRSLLRAGLVDRFRVVVFNVITGSSGRERIYDGSVA